MKNYIKNSVINVDGKTYLKLLIVIAPLLNFLSGIAPDLYVPSMPSIANYYSTSIFLVENTITTFFAGFAIGCLIFGILIDIYGRKKIIILGLLGFNLANIAIIYCQSIEQFIVIRFIQGVMVSVVSIGSRAIILDAFSSYKYNVALLYTSIAYGIGPVIAPFIGGILQYKFGWQANFLAYLAFGTTFLLIFVLYFKESIVTVNSFSFRRVTLAYSTVLRNSTFIVSILINSCSKTILIVYATIGPFIIENTMHDSPIAFGNTALLISLAFLLGALTSRFFMDKLNLHSLTQIGFVILIISSILQNLLTIYFKLNMFTILIPIVIICYSQGFIYPNVLARGLKIFPNNAGIAVSLMTCLIMLISAFGVWIISYIKINGLINLTALFTILITLQTGIFYIYLKPETQNS